MLWKDWELHMSKHMYDIMSELVSTHMNELMNNWVIGWLNEWMNEWMNDQVGVNTWIAYNNHWMITWAIQCENGCVYTHMWWHMGSIKEHTEMQYT